MTKTKIPPLTTVPIPGFAPEDTLIGADGLLYTGLRDNGVIIAIDPNTKAITQIATTGGAPLGLEWWVDGRLFVCNADLGPQLVDLKSGAVDPLPLRGGNPFRVCNNATVQPDGTVFISDSSAAYSLAQFRRDIIENTASGRLLRIDPDGTWTVLLDGLSFANGVAVLPDSGDVLVAETAKCKIHRVPQDGAAPSIFAETSGLPDNMSVGDSGIVWVALPAPRNKALDLIHGLPGVFRRLTASLPDALQPDAVPCCWVAGYSQTGELVHDFEGDPDIFGHVTGVREHNGRLYLGSIEQDKIAWFDLPST